MTVRLGQLELTVPTVLLVLLAQLGQPAQLDRLGLTALTVRMAQMALTALVEARLAPCRRCKDTFQISRKPISTGTE
jgi:hypothetical protein